jgi:hypothetical protein
MKRNPWIWAAIVVLLLTTAFHTSSFFVANVPQNDTEKQLHELVTTYKKDLGLGFDPSFFDLFTALSSCLSFLCLLSGLTLILLIRKRASAAIIKGVVGINLLIYSAGLIVMLLFTFIMPIACFALITLFLLLTWLTIREQQV